MQSITCYDSNGNVIDTLYQWDTNVTIKVSGADTSSAPFFHFCQSGNCHAYVVQSTVSDGKLVADIPNLSLQNNTPITVFLYYKQTNDGEGRSLYTFTIPVVPRQKPQDYTYEENIGYIDWVAKTKEVEAYYAALQDAANEELQKLSNSGFRVVNSGNKKYIQYSTDGEHWTNIMDISDLSGLTFACSYNNGEVTITY